MEQDKWIKQIGKDCSIQYTLCEHFLHPTVNDCVVVGNSSLRLLIFQSNRIQEIARYDHPRPIIYACITYDDGNPQICFISGSDIFFLLPKSNDFQILHSIHLDQKFSYVISNLQYICLYSHDNPSITLFDRKSNQFKSFDHEKQPIVWCCAFLNQFLLILEYKSVFQIKIYEVNDIENVNLISTHRTNVSSPYKFVSVPTHNSVYLLCNNKIIHIKHQASSISPKANIQALLLNGWSFNEFKVGIHDFDPLIIDAAPCGVRLFILTEGGRVFRFDGKIFEPVVLINAATNISSITISSYLVTVESSRLQLFDRNLEKSLDELSHPTTVYSSYTPGNFTVASQYSIHSTFFEYGIEIDRCSLFEYKLMPNFCMFKDLLFILFNDHTIMIDSEFKDVTPSVIKKISFDRVHANSHKSFFGLTSDTIYVYEYGSFNSYQEQSTLSSHRLNSLVIAEKNVISLWMYVHSTLLKQGSITLSSQVSALSYEKNIYASLFDQLIIIFDHSLNEIKRVNLDYLVFSISSIPSALLLGTGDGQILYCPSDLNPSTMKNQKVGLSTVHLTIIGNEITCMCDRRYFYLTENDIKKMPSDFLYFAPFTLNASFLGVIKSSKHMNYFLTQIHFSDKTIGFQSKLRIEFNQQVTKLTGAKRSSDFVCCVGKNKLYWSREQYLQELQPDEEVKSINEWKAKFKNKKISIWVVGTKKGEREGRLLMYNQNKKNNSIEVIFQKLFDNGPISSIAISTSSLAFFLSNNEITGFSVETGSLNKILQTNSQVTDAVLLDATEEYVAVLSNRDCFSVFSITGPKELQHIKTFSKCGIYNRIKIINNFVVVSSRVDPVLFIYMIENNTNVALIREINTYFLSPVTSISNVYGKALCTCICGEMYLISCKVDEEVTDADLARLFSFAHSADSLLFE